MREWMDSFPSRHQHPVSTKEAILLGVHESINTSKVVIRNGAFSSHVHFVVHLSVQPRVNVGPVGGYEVGKVDLGIS